MKVFFRTWQKQENTDKHPPSPSENGRFGVYHRGQNRYHDST